MRLDSLEAQAWFAHRIRGGLPWPQSQESRPANLNLGEAHLATSDDWRFAVAFVLQERRQRLPTPLVASTGRILTFRPGETLPDGAADAVTAGFFDVNNTPPWDTWIDFHDGTPYTWITKALEIMVQDAVDFNPEQCLAWQHPGWRLRRRREGGLEALCQHGIGHILHAHWCDLCCQSLGFPAGALRAAEDDLHGM